MDIPTEVLVTLINGLFKIADRLLVFVFKDRKAKK